MLPSVVASELEQVASDAIRTAFHSTSPDFKGLIDRFLADRERLFKGPFVSVALPFHEGSGRDWFTQIPLPFSPYRHQEKAFDRLLPGEPRNTLVATATGSGKSKGAVPVMRTSITDSRATARTFKNHCENKNFTGNKNAKFSKHS